MIRCSAFCLSSDKDHARSAKAAAKKVERAFKGREVSFHAGEAEVLALPLTEGKSLPVVHGWLGPGSADGEYSMVAEGPGGLSVSRDPAGTRPLYVGPGLRWAASDHRFFRREESRLLPPGSRCDLATGAVTRDVANPVPFEGTFEEAGSALAELVERAVTERAGRARKVAVAFSGGLDSSILVFCAKRRTKVVACSVFAPGSADSTNAPRAAEALGVELLQEELTPKKVEAELTELDLPFEPNSMDMSLWCIYSMASRMASDAGAETIMLGQLADELFGGYMKYKEVLALQGSKAAGELMGRDIEECGRRGFIRDEAACSRSLEPRFPFADRRVMEFGLGLPVRFKVGKERRKAVLRQAAAELGVPEELAGAPKKAAQYSSGILKILG